jgi:rhomboid family GlyGly-CTERM serine protease
VRFSARPPTRIVAEPAEAGSAWLAVAVLLIGGSALAWGLPPESLDWQPALVWREPWRWWTAAFVHWSALHLVANLGAALLVTLFGLVARVPASIALAWGLAWPLTHLGLLLQPGLLHYGGLSGVLHAGIAAAIVYLLLCAAGARRRIALALGIGLLVKLTVEAPWGPALRQLPGWDIEIAPLAHTTGAAAGAAMGALTAILRAQAGRWRAGRRVTAPAAAARAWPPR